MSHSYATTAQLRRALGNPSTTDAPEADLLRALESASAAVDAYTGRTFQPYAGVTYPDLTGVYGRGRLYIPDTLSLSAVAQDDGTGAYGTAWAVSDYLPWPYDAPSRQRPYTALERAYAGNYYWPYYPNWLRLTGVFGFWRQLTDTGATTAEALDTSETAADVSDQSLLGAGMTIRVDSEDMYVTALADGTPDVATVERAQGGSAAALHTTAAAISRYVYPSAVVEATLAHAQVARGGGMVAAASGVKSRRAGDLEIQYADSVAGGGGASSFDFGPWLSGYRRPTWFS